MYSERQASSHRSLAVGLYLGVPLVLLAALAQTALLREIGFLGVTPNLVLLVTVAWVLLRGIRQGIALGMLGGIVLEVNSGATFGTLLMALAAALSVAALGEVNLFRGAWFLKYMVILGATLVYGLVSVAMLSATGHQLPLGAALTRIIAPEMLIHLLLMAPIYGILQGLGLYLDPRVVELD